MKRGVNHIVRSAFESEGTDKTPSMVWSAINEELSQSKVDTAVKESFEGQHDTAPEMVWERLQDQLDIDRVWTRVADKINIRKYGRFIRYAAVALILLLPFSLNYDFSDTRLSSGVSVNNKMISSNERTTTADDVIYSEVSSENIQSNLIAHQSDNVNSLVVTESNSQNLSVEQQSDAVPVDAHLDMRPLTNLNQTYNLEIQPLFSPKPKRSIGLMIGGVSSLENTWIVDNETRSGFESESLVENDFSLGSSFGLFAEYQLKPQFSLAGEYLFQSRSNQNSRFYDNGIYSKKEREINSYKFALMLGWNSQPKYNGVSHSTVIRFGGYYSGVKSDYTHINGVITNVNSIYKRNDAGLRLELGKRLHLKSFIIDGGIKADYGLLNLASSKGIIPSHLNFTRLVSGGLYLKAAYVF